MSNFFSDIQIQLGQIRNSVFGVFDYQTEFGDLSAKVTLTRSNGYGYGVDDKQIIDHRIYFEYEKDDGTWDTFNNFDTNSSEVRYTIAPWQVGNLGGGDSKAFTHNYLGSRMELGKYLGVLRKSNTILRAKVRTRSKPLNYNQSDFNFANASLGSVPILWSGTGLKRVSNGTNGAMALHGNTLTPAATDQPFSSSGKFRVANIDKTYGAFRDLQVQFHVMVPNSSTTYSDGTNTMTNGPEANQSENLHVQYKLGNGSWVTGILITPNLLTPNVLTPQKFKIHQHTENLETVQIRFISRTQNTSSDDVYIIDSVKVYSTTEDAADQTGGNINWDDSYLYSDETTASALWAWDTSYTDIYWENDISTLPTWAAETADTDPYFELYNGEIRQARVVLGAKGISQQWSSGGALVNFFEIARAAKFKIRIQNWNPAGFPPAVGRKSKTVEVDQGFFLSADYTGSTYADGNWKQKNQQQRVELDLSSVFNISDFWETQQLWAIVEAYGVASNGEHYLVDFYNFSSQNQPFHFNRDTNQLPYSGLSFKNPGIDSYDLSIGNVRIKTTDTTSRAYKYNVGVWNGAGWKLGGITTNGWTASGPLDVLTTGEKVFFSGFNDVSPRNPYSYYGTAGQQGTSDTGLRVYTRALKGPNLTNDKIDGNNIVNIIPTLRRGWDFNTNIAYNGIQLDMSHDNNSTWTQNSLVIYADHLSASAHWFKIWFTTKRNGAVLNTDIYKIPGTFSTFNGLTSFNGVFYRDLNSVVPSGTLNARIPSIYDNAGYQVNVIVQALNNLEQVISSADSGDIEVSTNFGREAADLSVDSSIIVEGTGNTGARYVKATFSKNPTTGRAAFFRMDLYKTSITGANHLGTFFTTGTSSNSADIARTDFIKATSFANFQSSTDSYDKVYLTDLAGVGAFGDSTIWARLRPLDDAGTSMDYQDESYPYTGYKFIFGQGTAIFQEGQLEASYLLKVEVRSSSGDKTNDAYDYITLTASDSLGNEIVYTLPSNGNSAWYGTGTSQDFVNDENNAGLDIASLLTDRYTSTSVTCNLKAYAYGLASPNTTATLKSEINKSITVPAWTWTFATHSVTLPANDPNLGNRLEYTRLLVKGTASNDTTNVAKKFRLRVWNDTNTLYSGTAESGRKEFILQGSEFTTVEFSRYVDSVNGNFLDISDIISGNRWQSNDVAWDLNALREDETTTVGNGKAGILTIPALDWDLHAVNTSATVHSSTYNDRRIKVTVVRTNLTDVVPKIRVLVRRAETASGTSLSGSYNHRIILTPTKLDTTGAVASDLTEDFYFYLSDLTNRSGNPISMINIYDTVEYDVHIQGAYIDNGGGVVTFGDAAVKEVTSSASWRINTNTTTATLATNTANSKSLDLNIRGLVSSTSTQNPDGFNITFTRSDTNAQSTSFISFGSANVNNSTPNNISIAQLYDDIATVNHILTCQIDAKVGSSIVQTVSKAVAMSAEPKIEIQFSSLGGPLVAPGGGEHIAIQFKPKITAGFLSADETINLSFVLDGRTTTLTLTGDESNNWQYITLPTTKNVNTNTSTVDGTYPLTLGADYSMNRGQSNNLVSGDIESKSYDKIYHRFPKVLDTMAHNFDANGDGQIVFSFDKVGGLDANYIDNNPEWDFTITIEEEVVGTLDSAMLNLTKTTTSTAAFFNTNSIPLVSKIPLEANYSSNITMILQEDFSNNFSLHPSAGPNNYVNTFNNNNLNTSAPTFAYSYSGSSRTFQMNNVTMNDIANYPNTTVVPFDVEFTDVPGTYALSGKRVSFKVPIDFDNYFTNAEPYFSFGLKISHKDTSNIVRTTSGSYIQSSGDIIPANSVDDAKKEEFRQTSNYKVRDFTQDENGDYYFTFDLDIDDSAVDWTFTPVINPQNHVNYQLLVYVEDLLFTYDGDTKVDTSDSEAGTELVPSATPRAVFNDISTWDIIVPITSSDNLWSKNNALEVISIASNFSASADDSSTQVNWSFDYELESENSKPYSRSKIKPSVRYELKNSGGSSFKVSSSSGSESTVASTVNSSFNLLTSLNNNSYDPMQDLEIIIRPQTQVKSYTRRTSNLAGSVYSHVNRETTLSVNYKDLIIPSFDELDVDSFLNQDKVVGDTSFVNEIFWFYNKEELKNRTQVFDYSKEKIKIVRKVRQGGEVFDINHSEVVDIYGPNVTRTSHSSDLWKISWTDVLSNITPYTANNSGLDSSKPYSFEYELTPCFAYHEGANPADESIIEVTDKKISTFLLPDEFPIGNNGVKDLTYNHNSEHSIELLWKHVYNEDVNTLRSIGAKIYFDIYWFFDETDEQKQKINIMRPKNKKSKFYKEKQVDTDTWNLIDRIEYSYPNDDTLGEEYDFSYIWDYDKMEDDYKTNIAIITVIESEVVGNGLSQTVSSRGASNTLISVVDTDRKNRKRKMLAEKDLTRESLRSIKRGVEFDLTHIPNLEQVPISVTRKKAKPRGSNKPYSSST